MPSHESALARMVKTPLPEGKLTKLIRLRNRIRNLEISKEAVGEGKFVIRGFRFSLGGGEMSGEADIDWSEPNRLQRLHATLRSVDALDVLDAAGVHVDGRVVTPVSGRVELAWRGKSPTGGNSGLVGTVRLDLGRGSFCSSRILRSMAALTQNPAFERLEFERGRVSATIRDGKIRIHSLVLEGGATAALVEGVVQLKDDAMQARCGVWNSYHVPRQEGRRAIARAPYQFVLGGTLSKPLVSAAHK